MRVGRLTSDIVFSIFAFKRLDISQGSAATHLSIMRTFLKRSVHQWRASALWQWHIKAIYRKSSVASSIYEDDILYTTVPA